MAIVVVVQGCSPTSPGSPEMGLSTISGYVYRQQTPALGEPVLADVLITVKDPDGQTRTAMSDEDGFYVIAVRTGAISITASKDGYTATPAVQFDLLSDTILNFSLMQDPPELAVAVSRAELVARRRAGPERRVQTRAREA